VSRSGSGKLDPVLEGVELLFHQKGGSASFGAKMALPLNGVDLGCRQITIIYQSITRLELTRNNSFSTKIQNLSRTEVKNYSLHPYLIKWRP
jgi:hypothetical protein